MPEIRVLKADAFDDLVEQIVGSVDSAVEQSGQNAASAATSQTAAAGSAAQAQAIVDTATDLIITTFGNFDTLAQLVADHPTASVGNTAFVRETGEAGTVHRWSGSAWVDTGESPLAGKVNTADGFRVGPGGFPQILAGNVELLGFDHRPGHEGEAFFRLSQKKLNEISSGVVAELANRLPGIHPGPFPSFLDANGIETLGQDSSGRTHALLSPRSLRYVQANLDIPALTNTIMAGLLPSQDIVANGDSMSTPGVSAQISSVLDGRTVATRYQPGQHGLQMAVAMGAMPLYVSMSGNQIPASGGVAITTFSENILRSGGSPTGTVRVTILGVEGIISTDASNNWTFTRSAPGAVVDVPAESLAVLHPTVGTSFIPATDTYRGYTVSLRWGRNGLRSTRADRLKYTLEPLRAAIRFLTPRFKRVIVVSPYNARARALDGTTPLEGSDRPTAYQPMMDLNAEMAREFGPLYLDMRTSAVRNAIYDLGLTPTADDLADMALDCIPRQLFATDDTTHMGGLMQGWEGRFIGNRLLSLGY